MSNQRLDLSGQIVKPSECKIDLYMESPWLHIKSKHEIQRYGDKEPLRKKTYLNNKYWLQGLAGV